jgi:hypothetical protein
VLINARLQVDGLAADCGVLTRVEGHQRLGNTATNPRLLWVRTALAKSDKWSCPLSGMC